MTTKDKLISIAAFIVIVAVLWYVLRPVPVKVDVSFQDYLQAQNDSLRSVINQSNAAIKLSARKTDSLMKLIRSTDWKIVKTKEYYETIIHVYDSASTDSLQRFFSDRY